VGTSRAGSRLETVCRMEKTSHGRLQTIFPIYERKTYDLRENHIHITDYNQASTNRIQYIKNNIPDKYTQILNIMVNNNVKA
jgi:hypothetical protein